MGIRLKIKRTLLIKVPAAVLAGLAVLLIVFCDSDKTPTSASAAAATLKYVSGNQQTGTRLTRLGQPLKVRVLDHDGDPVPGYMVKFEVASLSGSLADGGIKSQEVQTNVSGETSVYLTLGENTDSSYTVQATATGASGSPLSGSPVVFYATAVAGPTGPIGPVTPIDSVVTPTDTSQVITFLLQVPDSVVTIVGDTARIQVSLTNTAGLPVTGQEVLFEVTGGSGFFAGTLQQNAAVPSDNYGKAAVDFITDTLVGVNSVCMATNNTLAPLSFTTFGAPSTSGGSISIITSAGQDTLGYAGRQLAAARVVRVLDVYGNQVPGWTVYWSVLSGGGNLSSSTTKTDDNGLAMAFWTMGPAPGLNRLQAHFIDSRGIVHKVEFEITALHDPDVKGPVYRMTGLDLGADTLGRAGTVFSTPLVVTVFDSLDHPLGDQEVIFIVEQGAGSVNPEKAFTNSDGVAQSSLTLGPDAGLNRARATVVSGAGEPLSVVFNIWGQAKDISLTGPNTVTIASGNAQTGEVSAILPLPLVVQVFNAEGGSVSNTQVSFTVVRGFGLIGPTTGGTDLEFIALTTDAQGIAAVTFKLGPGPDLDNEVVALITRFDGTADSVLFHIEAQPRSDTANRLIVKSGNYQGSGGEYLEGSMLPHPLVVRVVDTTRTGANEPEGAPISNIPVLFTVFGPEGATIPPKISDLMNLEPSGTGRLEAKTDADGLAAVRIELAREYGQGGTLLSNLNNHRVEAVVVFSDGSQDSVIFFATGMPESKPDSAAPATAATWDIAIKHAYNQTAEVNALLPEPLLVLVTDSVGEAVSNAKVTFSVSRGSGFIGAENSMPSVTRLVVNTNADGLVSFVWQLGPGPDLDNEVVAQIRRADGTVRTVTFQVQALPIPDTANRLVIMSGNYQGLDGNYVVVSELPLPLVVRVVDTLRAGVGGDTLGAPISNFPVLFESFSPSGDAAVSAAAGSGPGGTGRLEALTDADGLAAVRLLMATRTGRPDSLAYLQNNNRVVAVAVFADGSQDSVIFFATAVPGAPFSIAPAGATELSGIAGKTLSGLSVSVTDAFANSKAYVGISYSITSSPGGGALSQTSVLTDINGFATSGLSQLSTTTGTMSVAAVASNLDGSPVVFTITVSADDAAQIMIAGGNG
ncbi:MAG: hypothetical protein U9P14_09895, partial [Gemmatimonadota bacterium]|nr:hypothetical protein [Gemmatimonadota bacterium]